MSRTTDVSSVSARLRCWRSTGLMPGDGLSGTAAFASSQGVPQRLVHRSVHKYRPLTSGLSTSPPCREFLPPRPRRLLLVQHLNRHVLDPQLNRDGPAVNTVV